MTCPGESIHAETKLEKGCFPHTESAPSPLYTMLQERRSTTEPRGHPDTENTWTEAAQAKHAQAQHCRTHPAAPEGFYATALTQSKNLRVSF